MAKDVQQMMRECLWLMMKPLVRFCLRNNMGLMDIIDAAKRMLIECASDELEEQGKKVTSGLCVKDTLFSTFGKIS